MPEGDAELDDDGLPDETWDDEDEEEMRNYVRAAFEAATKTDRICLSMVLREKYLWEKRHGRTLN